MASYPGEIFDADNHSCEAHDAFTRHVPKRMRSRCVEWVELEGGCRYQVVGGKIDRTTNPTFDPISKPGVLRGYFKEDPIEVFREHVWINPFWEDDIVDVVAHMGPTG